jgi:hypothetical protein
MLAFACAAVACLEAQPPIITEPRKPFDFKPGAKPSADDKVWSAVVLGSNVKEGEKPAALPSELARFGPQLSKCFGYDQYRILGSATKAMDGAVERWLVPTQNFWVGATATRNQGGYLVNMEFFHDKRPLVAAKAMLSPGSPIFVRGPEHVRGQIIMVFEVKR